MDELEAAVAVLREEGRPLHWTVIQDLALRRGYLDPSGGPELRRRLLAALAEAVRGREASISKAGKGVYALGHPDAPDVSRSSD